MEGLWIEQNLMSPFTNLTLCFLLGLVWTVFEEIRGGSKNRSKINYPKWRDSMIRLTLWLTLLIQMIDHLALASELNRMPWYRNNWLYSIGLLIILVFVIKIAFNINFDGVKGKAGLRRPFPAQKRREVFNIYYREPSSESIQFRGKVIERRLKERGNNFKDLLAKVRRDYSYRVIDPKGIFLLASNFKKDKK